MLDGPVGELLEDQRVFQFDEPLLGSRVLIIVENLPVPFDRRVWQEAKALQHAGASVFVICPTGKGYTSFYEELDGIHIYRHNLPPDVGSAIGYLREYTAALFCQHLLTWKIWCKHGIDVIHACNPPDLIFFVALPYKLLGKKFIFDHHDINPELYEAKFNRKDLFWRLLCVFERLTFALADISIATNQSYRKIAIERGRMSPEKVFVVRSGPDLTRFKLCDPDPSYKKNRKFLVGYVGVMGEQEGIDLLLVAVADLVFKRGRHDIQFCLVGGGPSFAGLKVMAENLKIADYVTFLGRVPDKTLLTVLSSSDVCVNPDRVNAMNDKSTMNKIMEYMALGKPIVQFDVQEGRYSAMQASLYANKNDPIDFATKIEELLGHPECAKAMGAFGRKRLESELSWSHQTATLIAAYQTALANKKNKERFSGFFAKITRGPRVST